MSLSDLLTPRHKLTEIACLKQLLERAADALLREQKKNEYLSRKLVDVEGKLANLEERTKAWTEF